MRDEIPKLREELPDARLVNDNLAFTQHEEVHCLHGQPGLIRDFTPLYGQLQEVHRDLGHDLIQSQPIHAPEKLRSFLAGRPEKLLEDIRPLKGFDPIRDQPQDPDLVPVVFERYGVQLVGWTWRDVMELSFDTQYLPLLEKPGLIRPDNPTRLHPVTTGAVLRVGVPGGYATIADAVAAARAG